MKTCSKCGETKPLTEFFKVKRKGQVKSRACCKVCHAKSQPAHVRKAYAENYRRRPESVDRRRTQILAKAGFTPSLYAATLIAQGNKCAICRRPFTGWRTPRCAAADHDHKTGNPRGVLCMTCNTALSRFDDSPEVLLRAVAYLINPPAVLVLI